PDSGYSGPLGTQPAPAGLLGVGPRSIEPGQRSPWPVTRTLLANCSRLAGFERRLEIDEQWGISLTTALLQKLSLSPAGVPVTEPRPTIGATRLAPPLASNTPGCE